MERANNNKEFIEMLKEFKKTPNNYKVKHPNLVMYAMTINAFIIIFGASFSIIHQNSLIFSSSLIVGSLIYLMSIIKTRSANRHLLPTLYMQYKGGIQDIIKLFPELDEKKKSSIIRKYEKKKIIYGTIVSDLNK